MRKTKKQIEEEAVAKYRSDLARKAGSVKCKKGFAVNLKAQKKAQKARNKTMRLRRMQKEAAKLNLDGGDE